MTRQQTVPDQSSERPDPATDPFERLKNELIPPGARPELAVDPTDRLERELKRELWGLGLNVTLVEQEGGPGGERTLSLEFEDVRHVERLFNIAGEEYDSHIFPIDHGRGAAHAFRFVFHVFITLVEVTGLIKKLAAAEREELPRWYRAAGGRFRWPHERKNQPVGEHE
jgi:hypothetical protein